MQISDLVRNTLLSGTANAAAAAADPVAKALQKPVAALEQQIQKTQVKISAFGQVKSAFVDVQSAGKALADPKKTATLDDIKQVLQGFVAAFNNTNKVLAGATNGNGQGIGALASDNNARLAGNDLRRITTAGNNTADLRKIGVSVNQGGSLTLDITKLASAFQANPQSVTGTLAGIGRQAESTATRQLASTGNAIGTLDTRARDLTAQQQAQQARNDASQRAVQQRANLVNQAFSSNGIASYVSMFKV